MPDLSGIYPPKTKICSRADSADAPRRPIPGTARTVVHLLYFTLNALTVVVTEFQVLSGPRPISEYTRIWPCTRTAVTALFVTGEGSGCNCSALDNCARARKEMKTKGPIDLDVIKPQQ